MNLVIANTNATAFAVSRALNCTDRTEDGHYTNDTMSIIVAHVVPDIVAPNTLQDYTGGAISPRSFPSFQRSTYTISRTKKRQSAFSRLCVRLTKWCLPQMAAASNRECSTCFASRQKSDANAHACG